METVEITFDGVRLIVPSVNGWPLEMPHPSFDEFDTYCGPGSGLGDALVPDHIYGVIISPACYIHDTMFHMADPAWSDFHHSNSVFFHNILAIIEAHGTKKDKHKRFYRAVTYYTAVDIGWGEDVFWRLKKRQGRWHDTEGKTV